MTKLYKENQKLERINKILLGTGSPDTRCKKIREILEEK